MQSVRVTPVVGLPQFTKWSQVVDHIFGTGYHLVSALSITGSNAGSLGRDIVQYLLEQEPHNAQELYTVLAACYEVAETQGAHLSMSSGIFIAGASIFATTDSLILLRRKDKLGILLQSNQDISVVEGAQYSDDIFIFSTRAAEQYTASLSQQFAAGFDVDGVITSIVPAIHALEDSAGCALAFVTSVETKTSPQSYHTDYSSLPLSPAVGRPELLSSVPSEKNILEKKENSVFQRFLKNSSSAMSHTWNSIRQKNNQLFSKKTYVDGENVKKIQRIILIILVIILGSATVAFLSIRRSKQQTAQAAALIAPYTKRIQEISAQSDSDVVAARNSAAALVQELGKLQSQMATTSTKKSIEAIEKTLSDAQSMLTAISGKQQLSQLPIFYDLRLAVNNFVTSSVTLDGNTLVSLDVDKKMLVLLDTQTKQVTVGSDDSFAKVVALAPLDAQTVGLLGGGITTVALGDTISPNKSIPEGDSNRAGTLLAGYESYIYVFNPEKRNIYRYTETKGTYSDPIGWLQDPLGVPFTSVTSMSIDGDLWLTTKEGEIKKFSSGKKVPFTLTGLSENFTTPITMTTTNTGTQLYVLEPQKKRLVILDKNGVFLREVKSDSFASVSSVVVDEAHASMYIIGGSLVYQIAI